MSAGDEWWYEASGQRLGPITVDELKKLVESGQVGENTRVWKKGMGDWVAAGTQPALFGKKADAGMRMLLPVGRSGFAIAAGYLGILSCIPLVSLLAILFSTLAVFDLRKHPEKTGWGRIITGYVLGGLFLVIYGFTFLRR
jgi:GYF domain 2